MVVGAPQAARAVTDTTLFAGILTATYAMTIAGAAQRTAAPSDQESR